MMREACVWESSERSMNRRGVMRASPLLFEGPVYMPARLCGLHAYCVAALHQYQGLDSRLGGQMACPVANGTSYPPRYILRLSVDVARARKLSQNTGWPLRIFVATSECRCKWGWKSHEIRDNVR
jgi:hypothetical protein